MIIPDPDQSLIVRAGDTLIVRFARADITTAQMDQISAALEAMLPGVNARILTGMDELAVYRPEEPQKVTVRVDAAQVGRKELQKFLRGEIRRRGWRRGGQQ